VLGITGAGNPGLLLVDPDEELPDFTPIDFDGLAPKVRDGLVKVVSDARNWASEPTGVHDTEIVHVRGRDGRVGVRSIRTRMKRSYPGTHYIGIESDGFRLAVHTVWLSRRNTWAVYACFDGGRKGRFTQWQPFEWHPLSNYDVAGEPDSDREANRLERALDIAYRKARALRSEWGAVTMTVEQAMVMPFSPERVAVIQDGQSSGNGRRRVTDEREE
jgi:hypothetical protein